MNHAEPNVVFAVDAHHANGLVAHTIRSRLLHQRLNLGAADVGRRAARKMRRGRRRVLRLHGGFVRERQRNNECKKRKNNLLHYQLLCRSTLACEATCSLATPRDRKSTRLNSSHGYISYAVFCLKKKKALPSAGKP